MTSLPMWVLVVGCLALGLLVAFGARLLVRVLVPPGEYDHVQGLASPLMPALGAAFGVLIGLTLASEASYLMSAQDIVADEAAAASRLAWAATSPGVASEPVHSALRDYLQSTRALEWQDEPAEEGDAAVASEIARLEQVVRAEAARRELGTPASTELLLSLDAVTSSRRQRLAAASRQVPVLYVVTLIAGGAALIANAGALGFRSSVRTALLVVGLAAVVGLSLAVMFSLGGPWRGPLIVSGHPIDSVVDDLQAGRFQ